MTEPPYNRRPPHNINAEIAALGGILLSNGAALTKMPWLRAEHFAPTAHQYIFEKMLEVRAAGLPVNPVTLRSIAESPEAEFLLAPNGDIPGGAQYLRWLADHAELDPVPYATIVRDEAQRRAIIEVTDLVSSSAHNCRPVADVIAEAASAIESVRQAFSPVNGAEARFNLNWFSEMTDGAQDPKWRVHNLITECAFVVLYSETKAGKTLVAIDLGCRIANGHNWHGLKTQPGVVVHLVLEGQSHFPFRLCAWKALYGNADNYCFVNVPVRFLEDADVAELVAAIKAQVGDREVAAVIVDTVSRALNGGNENGPEDMGKFIAACDLIRHALQCAVIALHHSGVDKTRSRGHTSLVAAADLVMKVAKDGDIRRITIAMPATVPTTWNSASSSRSWTSTTA